MKQQKKILSEKFYIGLFALSLQVISVRGVLYSQGWQIQTIDNFYPAFTSTRETRLIDIGFDSTNTPHIVYYKDVKGENRNKLVHAVLRNNQWEKEIVDAMWARVGIAPIANSMTIDSRNQIFIIYQTLFYSLIPPL